MMSPTSYTAGEYRLKIWSKPALSTFPRLRVASSTIVGSMPGSVTCSMRWPRVAPSITAASYSAGSMPVIAARYTMVPKPNSFHTSVIIRIGRNQLLLDINSMGLPPNARTMLFTTPS